MEPQRMHMNSYYAPSYGRIGWGGLLLQGASFRCWAPIARNSGPGSLLLQRSGERGFHFVMASDYGAVNGREGASDRGCALIAASSIAPGTSKVRSRATLSYRTRIWTSFLSWRDWPNGLLSQRGSICGSDKVKHSENLPTRSS